MLLLLLVLSTVMISAEEGVVTTIAHTSGPPWGVHIDHTTGAILFTQQHSVQRIHGNLTVEDVAGSGTSGSSDGVGASASFDQPWGIAAGVSDPNHAYVADYGNHCLRRVDLATCNVTTFAGLCGASGSDDGIGAAARFYLPCGMALFHNTTSNVDVYLYLSESNHVVRRVEIATATVTRFAGIAWTSGIVNGPRMAALFYNPHDVTVDATGRWVYVTDSYNKCIRRIGTTVSDGMVTTLAGLCGSGSGFVDGVGGVARFNFPYGLSVDSSGSTLYVSDSYNCAIRRVDTTDGNVTTLAGQVGCSGLVDGPLAIARFSKPVGIRHYFLMDSIEALVVADYDNYVLRRVAVSDTASLSLLSASVSDSLRQAHTASSSAMSLSAPRPMTSTTLSNNVSATESGIDAPTARSVSLSATPSDSSWMCGTSDPRNVSLVGVTPSVIVDAASLGRRMLGVSAAVVDGTATPAWTNPSAQLSGAPLPRVALLTTHRKDTPLLLLGLSLQWVGAARWGVVSAAGVQHGEDTLTFNATTVTSSLASSGASFHEIAVLLWPPLSSPNGWVPMGLEPVYTATQVVVVLGLACPAEGGNTSGGRVTTVRVVVPAPGHPRELAEKVETTAIMAQWATAISGPGASSAVGRLVAVRSMELCGGGDGASGGGLIGLKVACGDNPDDSVPKARGAVVGNAGVLSSSIMLALLLVALYSAATRVAFVRAARRLGAPSVLLPVWVATLPSTSAGAMEVLLSNRSASASCAWDVAVAVLGLLVCAAPFAWICFVWLRLVPLLGLQVVEVPVARTSSGSRFGWMKDVMRDACRVQMRWVVHPESLANTMPSQSNPRTPSLAPSNISCDEAVRVLVADGDDHRFQRTRQAQVLLQEFRVLWYAALDLGVLVAAGALSASSGAGSHSLCVGAAASVCALYALQLVVCAAARPFTTRFAFVHALMTLTLSAASVGLQTGGVAMASAGDNGDAFLERREALAVASAVCDLFVIGISVVRVMLDISEGCRALASICAGVRRSRVGCSAAPPCLPQEPVASSLSAAVAAVPAETPSLPLIASNVLLSTDTDDDDDPDLLFWDAEGNAVQPQAPDGEGLLAVVADSTAMDPLGLPSLSLCVADSSSREF